MTRCLTPSAVGWRVSVCPCPAGSTCRPVSQPVSPGRAGTQRQTARHQSRSRKNTAAGLSTLHKQTRHTNRAQEDDQTISQAPDDIPGPVTPLSPSPSSLSADYGLWMGGRIGKSQKAIFVIRIRDQIYLLRYGNFVKKNSRYFLLRSSKTLSSIR